MGRRAAGAGPASQGSPSLCAFLQEEGEHASQRPQLRRLPEEHLDEAFGQLPIASTLGPAAASWEGTRPLRCQEPHRRKWGRAQKVLGAGLRKPHSTQRW